MAWAFPKGDVVRQSVGPKIATTGTWNADAMCIGPVSFVRSMAHRFNAAMSSRIVVAPDKTRDLHDRRAAMSCPKRSSPAAPKITTLTCCPGDSRMVRLRRSVTSANRSGSQRLAPP